jgi:3',5'-cyclic AMP phosphodiesterase CpdA
MVITQVVLVILVAAAGTGWSAVDPSATSVVVGTAGWTMPIAPEHPGNSGKGLPPVRLAVAGDVGTGAPAEWATAELMDRAEESLEFDALLLLGDNAYPHGDPNRLGDTVFAPFAGVLDGGTSLLGVLGNHDVELGHAAGQMAALGMPWRWYTRTFGDLLLVVLDSTEPDSPQQLEFLRDALETSEETWKVVALHHPPYAAGSHGSDLPAREAFAATFADNGVDLVLAGHEHDYERSVPIDGVTYVVSGGAAKLRPTGEEAFTEFSASVLHFVTLDVWEDSLVVTAFFQEGVLDRFVLLPE